MRDRLMTDTTAFGHYSVYVTRRGTREPVVDLEELAKALPHGSGLDGNWYLTVMPNGSVRCSIEVHPMDANGYYIGWRNVTFTVKRVDAECLREVDLTGPLLGQRQLIGKRGDLYTTDAVGGGREINEWVNETVDHALREAGVVRGLTYRRVDRRGREVA